MTDDIIRVLYLDDEEPNLFSFKAAFRRDFEIHTCQEPHEAVRMLDDQEFHVVLSDQRMPRISGVEFFELIMPDHPDVSRVLVTGYADTDAVVDAINKGQVYRFVSKPWNEEELRSVIKSGYDLNRSRVSNALEGQQVLSALDGFVEEVDRLAGELAAGGSQALPSIGEGLEELRAKMVGERVRYGHWVQQQNEQNQQ
ncbi:MAG: response regulator [Flavobacteriales bacterium]|nr:response regulator [Flavobacteriales bacterium]